MDRVKNVAGEELSLSAPERENGSAPRLAPSPPLRPSKDSPALLELEGSLSRDSLQSGGHSSEAVDTGSEGVCVCLILLIILWLNQSLGSESGEWRIRVLYLFCD